jgi:hypothetical protein
MASSNSIDINLAASLADDSRINSGTYGTVAMTIEKSGEFKLVNIEGRTSENEDGLCLKCLKMMSCAILRQDTLELCIILHSIGC